MLYELSAALPPGVPLDTYLEHQVVWSVAAQAASKGEDFLYRVEESDGTRLVRIRSRLPLWGASKVMLRSAGRLRLRVMCCTRNGDVITPVPDAAAQSWVSRRLGESGFSTSGVECGPLRFLEGLKGGQLIRLPIRDVECKYEVQDFERAYAAFRDGVGRAKRFGCGMLVLSGNGTVRAR